MTRVVVAGAGPVGLTAALVLARRGVAVTVLEQGDALAGESRASTFHPPTLEMLARLGVLNALLDRGIVASTFQYRERGGGPIATLDLGVLAEDTRFPFRVQCEQSKLTPILVDALPAHAEVRFGHRVEGVRADDSGVTVSTARGTVRGDWLIGADGAHSAVRASIGAGFDGSTYPERFLVASVAEDLAAALPDIAPINYVFDPIEWLVLLRTPEHWRVLLPTPDGTPDEHELRRLPRRLAGVAELGRPWRLLHASLYRVHQRVTERFRAGRVVLMGDAAHVNNPLGGLGMNSGIHDAVALAQALAAVLEGGPEAMLDAAAAHRRRVAVEHVQATSHANYHRLRGDADEFRRQVRALAADPASARAYLRRACLIDSLGSAR
ncbi:FAD-dependent monooxygenase [Nocardia sp. CDC159]|uniref:FAD-dependent monooxygenase n=1 Tax=Nocardia pulmonis TaxID=2951408 RepID=A0A9X2E0T9_9NOCA|nr:MULTISPECIES: NAD(P)/FAD-dependent oxidoreductase [Nocardia]MCM6771932.1 FAD-dependent monooxygenase [Nocardia pulmonis]MCM6785410.1 FAD-dependent monooxygenase [Nocardia sp. CDC159]